MHSTEVHKITDVNELQTLAGAWNDLLRNSESNTIFLTFEWINSWINNFLQENRLYVLVLKQGDTILGIAPLYLHRQKFMFTKILALRFLSDYGVGSTYLDFIARKGFEDEVVEKFCHYLRQNRKDFDLIILRELLNSCSTLECLKKQSKKLKLSMVSEDKFCSRIKLPQSWDQYLMQFKSNHRRNLFSKRNRLMKNYQVRFFKVDIYSDLEQKLQELFVLHQKRWVSKGFPGSFSNIFKRTFYYDLSKSTADKGWVRIYCLEVDHKIRAVQFGLFYNSRLLNLQEGFDPGWIKYEVGNLLRGMVIEEIIREGVHYYDFLKGNSDYKVRWKAEIDRIHNLTLVSNNAFKNWLFFTWCCLKKFGRRIIPRGIQKRIQQHNRNKKYRKVHTNRDSYLNLTPLFKHRHFEPEKIESHPADVSVNS
ncbi:MAG: hypothetical protein DHS20C17_30600 [Cyclobacteriaceae bacterium]|nr:MAG: hypothetical protein DHS20C17_30600 [Cyclobacteriaceae bacterium]